VVMGSSNLLSLMKLPPRRVDSALRPRVEGAVSISYTTVAYFEP
jgi:hypothetical protein